MQFPLTLHKLDTQQFSGNPGWVVFGPEGVPVGTRARPKFTLSLEQWEDLGRPTDITVAVVVQAGSSQKARVKQEDLAQVLDTT